MLDKQTPIKFQTVIRNHAPFLATSNSRMKTAIKYDV